MAKSLKASIDTLFNAMGGANKPSYDEVRSKLSTFASLAKALEDGQATAEKEAKIAALEAELGNLKVELQTANSDIKKFREEQKKRDEKERDIDPKQFEILERLGNPTSSDLVEN